MTHVDTILELRDELMSLERIEERVDEYRLEHPGNSPVQPFFDMQQDRIDDRREVLLRTITFIAMAN